MKKYSVKLTVVLLILVLGCKKSKNELPASPVSPAVVRSGVLSKSIEQETEADTLKTLYDNGGVAFFNDGGGTNFISVDSVSLNGIYLTYNSLYFETDLVTGFPLCHWHVKGNNGIPDFDFTNTNNMPSYSGFSSFPDSINRAQNITIPISGITNATHATIYIDDNNGHRLNKTVNITATNVTFTSSELSILNFNLIGFMYIVIYNENTQNIGGNNFNFQNQYQLSKRVAIY